MNAGIARVVADWPAPPGAHAFTTLRYGAGRSASPFDTFNLGNRHAADGDDPRQVDLNRAELVERFALPAPAHWLRQVHGTDVVRFDAIAQAGAEERVADAAVTSVEGVVLAILTADCVPVVCAAEDGSEIAAAHAGWPGLSKGMVEATVAAMRTPPARIVAWLGPCAGPTAYEVGEDVRAAFVDRDPRAAAAFHPVRPGHWLADLPALARQRLAAVGITRVHGGDLCTITDARFFSHRRDRRTGRMATVAWLQPRHGADRA